MSLTKRSAAEFVVRSGWFWEVQRRQRRCFGVGIGLLGVSLLLADRSHNGVRNGHIPDAT